MIKDNYGRMILGESDLVDLIMRGSSYQEFASITVDSSVDCSLFGCQPYVPETISLLEFDSRCQENWRMPEKYKKLDIVKYLVDKCNNDIELERCAQELLEFQNRNLLSLLQYLVYLVDIMQENNIIWGVGRGSSVSSFVLYLIGIHRVNPLEYQLEFRDFMR